MENLICPYCGKVSEWVENKEVYGVNYGKSYMIYLCRDCRAYVGCHENSRRPLGTMANKELRGLRRRAHMNIDHWYKNGTISRGRLYRILSDIFGFEVHVGGSDEKMCNKLIGLDMGRIISDFNVKRAGVNYGHIK